MNATALLYACMYLNNDMDLHGARWRLDPGKLAAALAFGKREAARQDPAQASATDAVDAGYQAARISASKVLR